ncbi:hypothetical protein PRZ48_007960 [Zasmidium cellare]|uniref:Uncharacterized protein n=1 Tax=Zasmidium cellare TaxID=395010 RepID=A0ABR0EE51_ZASCE|nr:hypothetical protein PRZ48_007960 [Zasmidium cellare]
MSGFNVARTDDPPPPPPSLDIILLTGSYAEAFPIGRQLAHDLGQGYLHLDIRAWLETIHAMPHGKHKSEALGLLHPLALKRYLEGKARSLSPKLVVKEVLLRRINQLVKEGTRRFVITGFTEIFQVWGFALLIAMPQAVVWFEQPESVDVRAWMTKFFGEGKCIFLLKEGRVEGVEEMYARLLAALWEKAMARHSKPREELRKEGEEVSAAARDVDMSKKADVTTQQECKTEETEPSPRNEMMLMLAKAALSNERMLMDTPTVSEAGDDVEMVDAEEEDDEDVIHVKRRDTPMVPSPFDDAMDLLEGLEEYASGRMEE